MSKPARRKKLDDFLFDDWVVHEFQRTGGFTALIILVSTANLGVLPLRSTFTHVIGDELDWHHFTLLMRGADSRLKLAPLRPSRSMRALQRVQSGLTSQARQSSNRALRRST